MAISADIILPIPSQNFFFIIFALRKRWEHWVYRILIANVFARTILYRTSIVISTTSSPDRDIIIILIKTLSINTSYKFVTTLSKALINKNIQTADLLLNSTHLAYSSLHRLLAPHLFRNIMSTIRSFAFLYDSSHS